MEKLSDQEIRIELINRLKEKVFKEIDIILRNDLGLIKLYSLSDLKDVESDSYNEFCYLSKEISICLFMREWITKHSFMGIIRVSEENDCVIYKISSHHLELWLQDDYNFMWNLIESFGYDALHLTDEMLEYKFTSIFEEALFREKKRVTYKRTENCPFLYVGPFYKSKHLSL